jgi:hypothetical protein
MYSQYSRLDLAPADLDRLEDALEDLELASALDERSGDDPVAQRLSEYREILRLGRDAMPLEDVPAGLLDGVIAQAHQAAAAAPVAAAAAPSFWSRWRLGVWVPALAFAGSAALLLVVLVPKRDEPAATAVAQGESRSKADSKAEAKADASRAVDGRLASAEPAREELDEDSLAENEDALRGGGVAIGERAPEPPPSEEQAAVPAVTPADLVDDAESVEDAPLRRKSASGGKQAPTRSTGSVSEPKPSPKSPSAGSGPGKGKPSPDPLGNDDTGKGDEAQHKDKKADAGDAGWAELARAEADRNGGNCGLAKMRYDKLRKLDDARVRARALAGAGLCAAASDDMTTAKKLFDQARNADPGVSSFIDRELGRLEDGRANADDPSPKTGD